MNFPCCTKINITWFQNNNKTKRYTIKKYNVNPKQTKNKIKVLMTLFIKFNNKSRLTAQYLFYLYINNLRSNIYDLVSLFGASSIIFADHFLCRWWIGADMVCTIILHNCNIAPTYQLLDLIPKILAIFNWMTQKSILIFIFSTWIIPL
jgi:hypothetical protein